MKLTDRSDLKHHNRRTVYDYIYNSETQKVSGAELSRGTGISLPTILKIIEYFEENQLLQESGTMESTTTGRRPTMLRFTPDNHSCVGMAYDGKYLELAIVNLNYKILHSQRVRVSGNVKQVMRTEIIPLLDHFLNGINYDRSKIFGVGLALPLSGDIAHASVELVTPMTALGDRYDFRPHLQEISERFGCPVFVENDVNAAALAEFKRRSLTSADDLVYITLGTGVGCGILLNGRLRRGKNYAAGEIGSMLLHGAANDDISARTLESLLNASALQQRFGLCDAEENERWPKESLIRIADYTARYLAGAIYNISVTLDVDEFVLGGFLFEQMEPYVLQFTREYLLNKAPVRLSAVSAPMVTSCGAGALAHDKALDAIFMRD